jgi:hypothetical protein
MNTFGDVIGLWPTAAEFASDVGVGVERARKWGSRNSIPGEWFVPIADAAQRRGFDVTAQRLAEIASAARRPLNGDAA